jgi:hypothetical protein
MFRIELGIYTDHLNPLLEKVEQKGFASFLKNKFSKSLSVCEFFEK